MKATATRENPIGAHLCVERGEIARIYSTSGTTGTPSYIPLTAATLTTGSRAPVSKSASGVSAGERIVSTCNAGPFVAGAALDTFERIGLSHIPVGTGSADAPCSPSIRSSRKPPCSRPPTPPTCSSGPPRVAMTCVARVCVVSSWPASPEAENQLEPSSRTAGARRSLRRWASETSARRSWGECEEQDGMHLGARGFVHAELNDPESGGAIAIQDGAKGELRPEPPAAP